MPKKAENLEAVEEVLVQANAPAAETEEMSEQTEAIQIPEIPEAAPAEDMEAPKPKRTRRKKAVVEETDNVSASEPPETPPPEETEPAVSGEQAVEPAVSKPDPASPPAPILTLEVGADVDTEESLADIAWHEIHNAYRTRRMLTGRWAAWSRRITGKPLPWWSTRVSASSFR